MTEAYHKKIHNFQMDSDFPKILWKDHEPKDSSCCSKQIYRKSTDVVVTLRIYRCFSFDHYLLEPSVQWGGT